MSDYDPEGRIFLYVPHTLGRFIFLHTFHFWKWVFDNAVTSIADISPYCDDTTWTLRDVITFSYVNLNNGVPWRPIQPVYIKHVKILDLYLSRGRIRVCEIRFASTGVICGNSYPLCKKNTGCIYRRSRYVIVNVVTSLNVTVLSSQYGGRLWSKWLYYQKPIFRNERYAR